VLRLAEDLLVDDYSALDYEDLIRAATRSRRSRSLSFDESEDSSPLLSSCLLEASVPVLPPPLPVLSSRRRGASKPLSVPRAPAAINSALDAAERSGLPCAKSPSFESADVFEVHDPRPSFSSSFAIPPRHCVVKPLSVPSAAITSAGDVGFASTAGAHRATVEGHLAAGRRVIQPVVELDSEKSTRSTAKSPVSLTAPADDTAHLSLDEAVRSGFMDTGITFQSSATTALPADDATTIRCDTVGRPTAMAAAVPLRDEVIVESMDHEVLEGLCESVGSTEDNVLASLQESSYEKKPEEAQIGLAMGKSRSAEPKIGRGVSAAIRSSIKKKKTLKSPPPAYRPRSPSLADGTMMDDIDMDELSTMSSSDISHWMQERQRRTEFAAQARSQSSSVRLAAAATSQVTTPSAGDRVDTDDMSSVSGGVPRQRESPLKKAMEPVKVQSVMHRRFLGDARPPRLDASATHDKAPEPAAYSAFPAVVPHGRTMAREESSQQPAFTATRSEMTSASPRASRVVEVSSRAVAPPVQTTSRWRAFGIRESPSVGLFASSAAPPAVQTTSLPVSKELTARGPPGTAARPAISTLFSHGKDARPSTDSAAAPQEDTKVEQRGETRRHVFKGPPATMDTYALGSHSVEREALKASTAAAG